MKKNGQVFLSLPTSRSEGGEGREKPPTGDTAEERIHIRIRKDNGSPTEGREKPNRNRNESRKKEITKGVNGRKKVRKGEKTEQKKEETSVEKRIHICISKGKRGKNVAKTEKQLRKNVYVGSKFLPMQGKGRPCVQD